MTDDNSIIDPSSFGSPSDAGLTETHFGDSGDASSSAAASSQGVPTQEINMPPIDVPPPAAAGSQGVPTQEINMPPIDVPPPAAAGSQGVPTQEINMPPIDVPATAVDVTQLTPLHATAGTAPDAKGKDATEAEWARHAPHDQRAAQQRHAGSGVHTDAGDRPAHPPHTFAQLVDDPNVLGQFNPPDDILGERPLANCPATVAAADLFLRTGQRTVASPDSVAYDIPGARHWQELRNFAALLAATRGPDDSYVVVEGLRPPGSPYTQQHYFILGNAHGRLHAVDVQLRTEYAESAIRGYVQRNQFTHYRILHRNISFTATNPHPYRSPR